MSKARLRRTLHGRIGPSLPASAFKASPTAPRPNPSAREVRRAECRTARRKEATA